MKNKKIILIYLLISSFLVKAQVSDEERTKISTSEIELESLYEENDRQDEELAEKEERTYELELEKVKRKKRSQKIEKLSDLVKLAPFSDIAVISKKYLPRTGRFEIAPTGVLSLNNPFFDNMGLGIHLGYSFSEKFGVEFIYDFMTDVEKSITENLRTNRAVSTRSLVVPKSFLGGAIKWSPIYGKIAWFQESIVPFEMYFTPGIGLAGTEEGNEIAYQLGTGQIFALTKSMAVRWDLNWRFYNAKVTDKVNNVDQTFDKFHSDFILQLGVSFFFPGVRNR